MSIRASGRRLPQQSNGVSDLDALKMRMNEVTDQSLESTRNMVRLAEEAKEAGISTLVMLDEQGGKEFGSLVGEGNEQLDNIEQGLDQINADMRDAEKDLDQLNKCCGLFTLPWKKRKNFERSSDYKSAFKASEDTRLGPSAAPHVVFDKDGMVVQGGYITRITHDEREEEMDQNLQEVSNMLGNLKNMATDMNAEIEQQNSQLDRLNQKAMSNEGRIRAANAQAHKILK